MLNVRRVVLKTLSIILIISLAIVLLFFTSPFLTVGTYYVLASEDDVVENEINELNFTLEADLAYSSEYKNNTFDLYSPINDDLVRPTIIWIYSLNFFFGSSKDLANFLPYYALEGFNVVALNFERGYNKSSLKGLKQIGEAYNYLTANANQFKIDIDNIYFAGSNSGATIASQFVNSEYNLSYADDLKLEPVGINIKGLMLFYGLGEVRGFSNVNEMSDLFYKRLNWQYYNSRNWMNGKAYVLNNLENFPKTYITEANNYTYMYEGNKLANALKENGNVVTTFFPNKDYKTADYKYNYYYYLTDESVLGTAANLNFSKTISFLNG